MSILTALFGPSRRANSISGRARPRRHTPEVERLGQRTLLSGGVANLSSVTGPGTPLATQSAQVFARVGVSSMSATSVNNQPADFVIDK